MIPVILLISFLFNTNNETAIQVEKQSMVIQLYNQINPDSLNLLSTRFKTPAGYVRKQSAEHSFGWYLQHLPLKPVVTPVKFFDGKTKANQYNHLAVIDMEIGNKDLQQCADAVMRLRAEFLYSEKRYNEIAFNFVSDGKPRYFVNFDKGKTDYKTFRNYMDYVFNYANTLSLKNELKPVADFDEMQIGDVLIQTGNPYGHAVIVIDLAVQPNTGRIAYMLAQSFMPAQDIHILVNPRDRNRSPWYDLSSGDIYTPDWKFSTSDLYRFE